MLEIYIYSIISIINHSNTSPTFVWDLNLTHWARMVHICIDDLTIIGSDNGLLPGQCQVIIRINAGIWLIGPLGTNFSEISMIILTFSLKKMRLKMSSVKWQPFCLGLNVLNSEPEFGHHCVCRCPSFCRYWWYQIWGKWQYCNTRVTLNASAA